MHVCMYISVAISVCMSLSVNVSTINLYQQVAVASQEPFVTQEPEQNIVHIYETTFAVIRIGESKTKLNKMFSTVYLL